MITLARVRTFLLWALMRLRPYPRLGEIRALVRPLLHGRLLVRGGLGTRLWLSAAHFDPFSAQAYLYLTGAHEPMVCEALRRSVGPGTVVYDVGANIGFEALIAARLGGRVVAVEPQREICAAVRENARLNGFDVTVVHAAAGAEAGSAELIVVDDSLWTRLADVGGHDREARRETVPVIALDDLRPEPDVVKIDVEGAELDVLAGMRRLLATRRPIVIAEMHGKNAAFADAMEAAGYRVVNLDGPQPVRDAGGNVHAYCEPREPGSSAA